MEQKKTCRWAALSLSNIASVFLPDLLGREDAEYDHKLVAISTTGSNERAQKWLKDNKIPDHDSVVVYNSWERMLEEADFDIVYISTPHPLHYEGILKAIECKRNILVEKPATMNAAQYRRCIELANQQGVVMMEAMWTRYLPATRYLKEELLPKIGKVRRVFSDFSFPIVGPDLQDTSRFLDKSAGAGALLDQGVYALTWVDLALNGLEIGATNVVHSSSWSVPERPGEVDDINTVVLANKGATAIVTTSMTIPGSSQPRATDPASTADEHSEAEQPAAADEMLQWQAEPSRPWWSKILPPGTCRVVHVSAPVLASATPAVARRVLSAILQVQ